MQPIDFVKSDAAGGRIPNARYMMMYVVAACIVSLGIAAAWAFRASPWLHDPTDLDARLTYVGDQLISDDTKVDLLVLGSSRPAFGIYSYDLAQAIGLGRTAALNLAFPGFRPEAIVRQIRAHMAVLSKAKVWVIGIDDYYLLSEHPPAQDAAVLKRAEDSLEERLSPVMKLNAMGRELERNVGISLGWKPELSLSHWTMGKHGAWDESRLSSRIVDPENERAVFQSIIDSYFKMADGINKRAVQDLRSIISVARKNGIKVTLVSMPYHSTYDAMASMSYPALVLKTVGEVHRLAKEEGVRFIDCRQSTQNCGVSDDDFADPVHLNASGSAKFTAFLARSLHR